MRQSQVVLEWLTEAELKRARADLIRALQVRLETEVPADLRATIEAKTDLDELTHWFDVALTTRSLEAFRTAVHA
jgi:hypothetical protein